MTLSKHHDIVHDVLSHLDEESFALKLSKCEFALGKLEWLGFDIRSTGHSSKFSKIEANKNLAAPGHSSSRDPLWVP